jgi:hypothetical protein
LPYLHCLIHSWLDSFGVHFICHEYMLVIALCEFKNLAIVLEL